MVLARICSYTNWKVYIACNFNGHVENEGLPKVTSSQVQHRSGRLDISENGAR